MDKSRTPQKNVVKMERAEAVETKEVNFLSFNCKNIKTIGPFLHHHHNKIDILLLQEHWLFDHELSLLNEVSQNTAAPVKPSILEMKISFLQNVTEDTVESLSYGLNVSIR